MPRSRTWSCTSGDSSCPASSAARSISPTKSSAGSRHDRLWGLCRAARVIADECVVVGVNYDVDIETTFAISWKRRVHGRN